jgi:hypothetical protein
MQYLVSVSGKVQIMLQISHPSCATVSAGLFKHPYDFAKLIMHKHNRDSYFNPH